MNEHFLTYEQSLAVKELGFDEECLKTSWGYDMNPLKSQFFKWVREKGLVAEIFSQLRPKGNTSFGYKIGQNSESINDGFDTYEQAEDVCINKIIELIKAKQ